MEKRLLSTILCAIFVCATSATSIRTCSSYCICTDVSLDCKNGYAIESVELRLLPKTISNIKIESFSIRELTANYLRWFTQLKQLSLTDCRMRVVSEDSFADLARLESIDLHDNHLAKLPPKLFESQGSTTSLNLSQNLLDHLPDTLFQNTTSLKTLDISYNRIRLLPSKLFYRLSKLRHLDLSHNEISYVLPSTFSFISIVRYIDLSDNLLVTVHEDLFDSNNITILTNLSLAGNPLDCNCGLVWLRRALLGEIPHLSLVGPGLVYCDNPHVYRRKALSSVPLEQLNCTSPSANIKHRELSLIHRDKVKLECHASGSPYPSIVWKTPMGDLIMDPYRGEWVDGSINFTSPMKKYRIYATGDTVMFSIRSFAGYSTLYIDSLHLVSSGVYECIAINPGGRVMASVNITLVSSVQPIFHPSLVVGAFTVFVASVFGIIGCSVTVCVEKCTCCTSMSIKYYDGIWMNCHRETRNNNAFEDDQSVDTNSSSSSSSSRSSQEDDPCEDDELLDSGPSESSVAASTSYSHCSASEINEHTALTADEWDAYFREYPDDFIVEGLDASPKKFGSPQHSNRGSPTHRSHGKTLETLEGVRVRLKLRVEQIDVMKERLRIHVEKRSARMKENIERRKLRMNKRMQTIKESTSQSLQSIRETGRNYSHKLHMGVRTAMENVGAQVQSLKEFCGTGDLGQTLSIATITTDIDTNEKTEIARSVTMV